MLEDSSNRTKRAAQYEVLREVFRVVEYRDGAVYRTESLGVHWVDEGPAPKGYIHAPVSTDSPHASAVGIRKKKAQA